MELILNPASLTCAASPLSSFLLLLLVKAHHLLCLAQVTSLHYKFKSLIYSFYIHVTNYFPIFLILEMFLNQKPSWSLDLTRFYYKKFFSIIIRQDSKRSWLLTCAVGGCSNFSGSEPNRNIDLAYVIFWVPASGSFAVDPIPTVTIIWLASNLVIKLLLLLLTSSWEKSAC